MRPIKLTMSAFGSYSGMETIDFTKIQGGLFLVTGDTGAGKTTIFDSGRAVYDPKKPGIYARGKAEKCRRKDPPCKGNVKSQPDHARREGVSGEKA